VGDNARDNFKTVIGKTELVLPDDWPEFPKEPELTISELLPEMT